MFKCRVCLETWQYEVRNECNETGVCWGCMIYHTPEHIPREQIVAYIKLRDKKDLYFVHTKVRIKELTEQILNFRKGEKI